MISRSLLAKLVTFFKSCGVQKTFIGRVAVHVLRWNLHGARSLVTVAFTLLLNFLSGA